MYEWIAVVLFSVILGLILAFTVIEIGKSPTGDERCRAAFGADWSYYYGRAADCVNSQGEGKFLKK